MDIDDLMNMTIEEVLDTYCVVYSPECGYYYGITTWDEANQMWDEFELEDEYCFSPDFLIPIDYGFDRGEKVLDADDLRRILDYLGLEKKTKQNGISSKK